MSNSFDTSFRHQISTIFYKKFCRILSKLPCVNRKMLSKASFDNFFRQNATKNLSNFVDWRHLLAKNLVEKCCRASTIFFYNNFRQSSTAIYKKFVDCRRNLSNAVEIYCRKILAKNLVEKCCISFSNDVEKRCRILDSTTFFHSIRHFSTKNFGEKCWRKFLSKNIVEIYCWKIMSKNNVEKNCCRNLLSKNVVEKY